jgi:hypothetical protein
MKKSILLLLGAIALFWATAAQAQSDLNTISQGTYNSWGYVPNPRSGYLVGNTSYSNVIHRPFFVFNIPSLALGQSIKSSILSIYNPSGGVRLDGYRNSTLNVYGFTGSPSDLVDGTGWWSIMYANLGNGTLYGSTTLDQNQNNTTYSISLNDDGLTAINQASGGYFSLGLVLPVATINPNTQLEYGFNNTSSSTAGDGNVQLSIDVIPEPSAYALFGIGALALVVAYRRKVA